MNWLKKRKVLMVGVILGVAVVAVGVIVGMRLLRGEGVFGLLQFKDKQFAGELVESGVPKGELYQYVVLGRVAEVNFEAGVFKVVTRLKRTIEFIVELDSPTPPQVFVHCDLAAQVGVPPERIEIECGRLDWLNIEDQGEGGFALIKPDDLVYVVFETKELPETALDMQKEYIGQASGLRPLEVYKTYFPKEQGW